MSKNLRPRSHSPATRRAIGTILGLFFVAVGIFALMSPQGLAEPDAHYGTGRRGAWTYTRAIAFVVEHLGAAGSAVLFFAIAAGVLIWTYRDFLVLIRTRSQQSPH